MYLICNKKWNNIVWPILIVLQKAVAQKKVKCIERQLYIHYTNHRKKFGIEPLITSCLPPRVGHILVFYKMKIPVCKGNCILCLRAGYDRKKLKR